MTTYRIVEWNTHFENNRTRELRYMEWVPIPIGMDGDGYTQLVAGQNGAANLGTWIAIVEVAARCDPRGTLLRRPVNGVREPHTTATLSRISRIPEDDFKRVLPLLLTIGWIETCDDTAEACGIPAPCGGEVPTERNGTERNGITPPPAGKWKAAYSKIKKALPPEAPTVPEFTYHDFVGLFATSHRGIIPDEVADELAGRVRHEPAHRWAQFGIVRCLDYMLGDVAKNFRKAEVRLPPEAKPLGRSGLPA